MRQSALLVFIWISLVNFVYSVPITGSPNSLSMSRRSLDLDLELQPDNDLEKRAKGKGKPKAGAKRKPARQQPKAKPKPKAPAPKPKAPAPKPKAPAPKPKAPAPVPKAAAAAAGGGADASIAAAAAGGDIQKSLEIDPTVLAAGFENNGQKVKEAGQVPSLTSSNNFINYCKGKVITNGLQVKTGSCNPAPMGDLPAIEKMPSTKFVFPLPNDKLAPKKPFTIKLKLSNIELGFFTNAQQNYFSAPQQLNKNGVIKGHTHVVIEKMTGGMRQTATTNPQKFVFFKGINSKADGEGIVTADVTTGLTEIGVYRACSMTSAMNHQPAIAPVAQHGGLDDCVYFNVENGGNAQEAAKAVPAAPAANGAAAKKGGK